MIDYKLLPCPFCGGEAATYEETPTETTLGPHGWTTIISPTIIAVGCDTCGYNLPYKVGQKEAANAWNTRAQLSRQKGE